MYKFPTLLIGIVVLVSSSGCGYFAARVLEGEVVPVPDAFDLESDKTPCYLELHSKTKALRMNCFDLDGVLHIHSSRWAKLPRFTGESWTITVRKHPQVRIEVKEQIHLMSATLIDDEARRQQILYDRGYWHPWDAISVFRFDPVAPESDDRA